jgi:hypothetical protein
MKPSVFWCRTRAIWNTSKPVTRFSLSGNAEPKLKPIGMLQFKQLKTQTLIRLFRNALALPARIRRVNRGCSVGLRWLF